MECRFGPPKREGGHKLIVLRVGSRTGCLLGRITNREEGERLHVRETRSQPARRDPIPFDSQHVHYPIAACSRSRLVSASIRSLPDSNDQLAFFSIRWSIQPGLRFR
ncbi:hypothetical protein F2Q69_00024198 [Brassica cretica]|uniref:Uncharacterized protein n=1 Tax=Brassica cretica TaxID=69181 RepID=A0A8S9Q2K4_BRACR|nr:hypothetical protein F2Q69_00024198 [Brassica cretica]